MRGDMGYRLAIADCLILCLVTLVIGVLAYHPFYFGDELQPFAYSLKTDASFWSVYSELNKYKARLLFNGIWSLCGINGAPRYVFMLLTVAATGLTASIIYCVARAQFEAGRVIAVAAGLVVPTSRFATLTYFDYLSGTIESLSALIYLFAVAIVFSPKMWLGWSQARRYAVTLLACSMVVLVHERYVAGVFALGVIVAVRGIGNEGWSLDLRRLASGAVMALVPLVLFFLATKASGALSVNTGTSGKAVVISFGIFWRFLRYCENVLFGLNGGYPWLVGSLQYAGRLNVTILSCLAALFSLTYLGLLAFWRKGVDWRKVAEIALLMCALICVASLPAADRQEGRWMIPVYILMTLAVLHLGRARFVGVALLLVTNLAYAATGSYLQIANVVASRAAEAVAAPINRVAPEGDRGIVMNAPDNGDAWAIGGGDGNPNLGRVFSALNLDSKVVVDPGYSTKRDYDFALYYIGVDSHLRPLFSYVGKYYLGLLLNPENITQDMGVPVAGKDGWKAWRWSGRAETDKSTDTVELRPGVVGTLAVPAVTLDHKLIVYRARALGNGAVPMRIQINWDDGKGKFLGAFIKVVNVSKATENFAAVVAAPAGAREGTVYANLHDGARGNVELSSIRLIEH